MDLIQSFIHIVVLCRYIIDSLFVQTLATARTIG